MYQNASSSYVEKINRSSRTFRAVIYDQYGEEIGSVRKHTIQKSSVTGSDMTIGAAFAASCSITLQTEDTFRRQEVVIMTGIENEMIPDGVFTIVSSSPLNGSDNIRTLTGYDRMYIKGNDAIVLQQGIRNYKARVNDVCGLLGVDLDPNCISGINDFEVTMPIESNTTVAEYAGWLAGLIGRNAFIDRLGQLTFKAPEDFGYEILEERSRTGGVEDEPRVIEAVKCNNTNTDLWAGDPNSLMPLIVEQNPMMTQGYLAAIMTQIEDFTYYAGSITMLLGDNRIDPWDIVTYKSKKLLCSEISYEYDGGFQQEVTSAASSSAADISGSDLYADLSAAKQMMKNSLTSVRYMYAASSSDQTAPESGWATTRPTPQEGQFIWQKSVFHYADGHEEESAPICESSTDGQDGFSVELTNPGYVFSGDKDGRVSSAQTITTQIQAYQGESSIVAYVNVNEITKPANISVTSNGSSPWPTLTITAAAGLNSSGVITIPVHIGGAASQTIFNKIFAFNIARTGATGEKGDDGTSPTTYDLIVSHAVIVKSISGTYNPSSITLTGKSQTGSAAKADYAGRFKIETTANGSSWTTRYTSSSNQSAYTYTVPVDIIAVRCSLYLAGGTTTLLDQQTVPIVSDGQPGAQGEPGEDGDDGTDGEDAYTVILTNENHTFAGDTEKAIAAYTECGIIAYKGATQIAATIGTISGMPTGMTTEIYSNISTSAYFRVRVTNQLTTRNGILSVPVTVDGKEFVMKFTYSLALTGARGDDGTDVVSTTYFFYAQASSIETPPAKPTTLTPPSGWATTEPEYDRNNVVYMTIRTVYSEGNPNFEYSDVSLSSSFEAAKQAHNQADAVYDALDSYREQNPDDVEDAINSALNGDPDAEDPQARVGALGRLEASIEEKIAAAEEGISNTIASLDELVNSLQREYTQYASSFAQLFQFVRFPVSGSFTGIEIGLQPEEGQTPMQIKIGQKDGKNIVMLYNGENSYGWWDGENFHTGNIYVEVTQQARFGNFAFIPRDDGSLMFLKVAED